MPTDDDHASGEVHEPDDRAANDRPDGRRRDAREGPMSQEALVELLNEDLELEYRSIVQYVNHIATVKGVEFQSTLDELTVHVGQELEHALVLARQIDFLGGTPSTTVPVVPNRGSAREAMQDDLDLETTQLERYRERVVQADEIGLPDVAEALAPLLQQTQEHARDLIAVLGEP